MAKTDEERGDFGAWAYNTRTSLELSVEQVARSVGYDESSIRKADSGLAASRAMRSRLWTYYKAEGARRGVTVTPPPGLASASVTQDGTAALVAAISAQTEAISALVAELRASRAEESEQVRRIWSPEGQAVVVSAAVRVLEARLAGSAAAKPRS